MTPSTWVKKVTDPPPLPLNYIKNITAQITLLWLQNHFYISVTRAVCCLCINRRKRGGLITFITLG